jgi:hypothetical protein
MEYRFAGWKKLEENVYDAGNQIVVLQKNFLASLTAILIGGIIIFFAGIYIPVIFIRLDAEKHFFAVFLMLPIILGLWLMAKGFQGRKEREEKGGIHPADTLIIFDSRSREVRRKIGGTEEHLANFDEISLTTRVVYGKIQYHLIDLTWPNKTTILCSSSSENKSQQLLINICDRLGLPSTTTDKKD